MDNTSDNAQGNGPPSRQPPQQLTKGKFSFPIWGWFLGLGLVLVIAYGFPLLAQRLHEADLRGDAIRFASSLEDCLVQGAWRDKRRYAESIILLCKQDDGALRVYREFDRGKGIGSHVTGDIAVTELVFQGLFIVESQRNYETFGDHLIVRPSGELELWDNEGIIATAFQIRGIE